MAGMVKITNTPGLVGINHEQRLYVLPCGDGFSSLGFDVAFAWATGYAQWANRPDLKPTAERGTVEAFREYKAAEKAAHDFHRTTGQRCPIHLTPALLGLEGARVEVTSPGAAPRRYWVSRSTGWAPCHLEIARRDSSGGDPVYMPDGARVRVVESAGSR